MKLFKKIFLPLLAALTLMAVCVAFAACGETDIREKYSSEDDATNWDKTTYVVYLELPDGSPVADVDIEVCSGNNCIPSTSNEDGRASFTFSSSQEGQTVYLHFSSVLATDGSTADYGGPDGYTLPSGGQANYNAGTITYHHVWFLTEKVTTLVFVAE